MYFFFYKNSRLDEKRKAVRKYITILRKVGVHSVSKLIHYYTIENSLDHRDRQNPTYPCYIHTYLFTRLIPSSR